jgi:alkanesulfonate monooxygenase SsuD/methylene tetrahydromethanopterin reductase-like flavin-dependent oxidoreductase (luciferase family)
MIKLWSFEFNYIQCSSLSDFTDPSKVQQTFDDTLMRLAGLEDIGFEGVFFSEHHFINALSPTPNLCVAALAQRTRRMRLGVMGNVLPFHQPWRLAEELGTLDYLTGGRLEIGMSSGVPPEFTFVNIDQQDARPIYEEVMEFLERASTDRLVSLKGKHFDFDEVPILPRMRPEARRRKWVTLYSPATARAAAERNFKICTAYQSVANARKAVDAYQAKADELGIAVGPDDVGLRRQVLICETDQEAEEIHPGLLEASQKRAAQTFATVQERLARHKGAGMAEGVKQTGVMDATAPARPEGKNPLEGMIAMDEEFIFGSPETVAEKIIEQCRGLGCENFMPYHSSALSREQVKHMYGSLWPKVVPIIASANIVREPA